MVPAVLVFDLDGVIVKTNITKHDAMLSLFKDYPDQRQSISGFILSNGGVPRREKLARILQEYLRVEATESLLARYLAQYAVQLEHRLAAAPYVEGVLEFITTYEGFRYVCSSAPETEVHEQIFRRSLQDSFAAIYGGSTTKQDALRKIAAFHKQHAVVFFGDSVGDYEASRQAKVRFVGIVSERDNFQGMPVVTLKDFTSMGKIQLALHKLAAQSAA